MKRKQVMIQSIFWIIYMLLNTAVNADNIKKNNLWKSNSTSVSNQLIETKISSKLLTHLQSSRDKKKKHKVAVYFGSALKKTKQHYKHDESNQVIGLDAMASKVLHQSNLGEVNLIKTFKHIPVFYVYLDHIELASLSLHQGVDLISLDSSGSGHLLQAIP